MKLIRYAGFVVLAGVKFVADVAYVITHPNIYNDTLARGQCALVGHVPDSDPVLSADGSIKHEYCDRCYTRLNS